MGQKRPRWIGKTIFWSVVLRVPSYPSRAQEITMRWIGAVENIDKGQGGHTPLEIKAKARATAMHKQPVSKTNQARSSARFPGWYKSFGFPNTAPSLLHLNASRLLNLPPKTRSAGRRLASGPRARPKCHSKAVHDIRVTNMGLDVPLEVQHVVVTPNVWADNSRNLYKVAGDGKAGAFQLRHTASLQERAGTQLSGRIWV